jgi:hypothetical protein
MKLAWNGVVLCVAMVLAAWAAACGGGGSNTYGVDASVGDGPASDVPNLFGETGQSLDVSPQSSTLVATGGHPLLAGAVRAHAGRAGSAPPARAEHALAVGGRAKRPDGGDGRPLARLEGRAGRTGVPPKARGVKIPGSGGKTLPGGRRGRVPCSTV